MANKRKTTTAIVAGVTAAALLLGGTFAWTSISQQARNEAIVDINPGGRLHDDFNGTNKDVYVENFGDDETGVPIFARIRLYEYMEIGQQAGDQSIADDERKAKPLIEGDTIGNEAEWDIYKYNTESEFTKYWEWKLGNDDAATLPYYMPTFNMNKDSLATDTNGTYEGTINGDIVHYDDYVQYDENSVKEGTEVYDWDDNDTDEEENPDITTDDITPRDDADVYHKSTVTDEDGNEANLTHTAKQLSATSTVMSMEEFLDPNGNNGVPGNFWVFDIDGWAYWANPIAPGKTTGLLLDSIQMIRVPDDSWYYAINVVAQFATASDLGAFNTGDETMTDDAMGLLGSISNQGVQLIISGDDSILIGNTATYSATLNQLGVAFAEQPEITLSIENIVAPETEAAALSEEEAETETDTGISIEGNSITIADTVAIGTTFDIKAEATVGETGYTAVKTVTVADWKLQINSIQAGSLNKVSVDGLEWYVLAKDEVEGKALIWLADVVRRENDSTSLQNVAFGETNVWRDSNVRTWLKENFLPRLTTLSGYIYETDITTAAKWNRVADENGDVYITTTDKVFLLSEADFTGTIMDTDYKKVPTYVPEEYTLGKAGVIVSSEMCALTGNPASYTRSPSGTDNHIGGVSLSQGEINVGIMRCPGGWTSFVRPAMWVSYTDEVISE